MMTSHRSPVSTSWPGTCQECQALEGPARPGGGFPLSRPLNLEEATRVLSHTVRPIPCHFRMCPADAKEEQRAAK